VARPVRSEREREREGRKTPYATEQRKELVVECAGKIGTGTPKREGQLKGQKKERNR